MAVLSKVLPLTASCLAPLPGFESRSGQVRKLPVTLGQVLIFARFLLQFNVLVQSAMSWRSLQCIGAICNAMVQTAMFCCSLQSLGAICNVLVQSAMS